MRPQNKTRDIKFIDFSENNGRMKRQRSESSSYVSEQKSSKNSSSRKSVPRGIWTSSRKEELLQSYLKYRPHGVTHGEQTRQWDKIVEDVNNIDSDLNGLKKQAIQHMFEEFMDTFEPIFTEKAHNSNSGSNTHSPKLEKTARKAWEARNEDKAATMAQRDKKVQELKEKEDDAKMLQQMSIEGKKHHMDKKKDKGKGRENAIVAVDEQGVSTTMETPSPSPFSSPSPPPAFVDVVRLMR